MTSFSPKKDAATVTPEGERIATTIQGVQFRPTVTHIDERGSITEIYNPGWRMHEAPLVYVYQFTVRPGWAKGWIIHHDQDDRMFISQGEVKVILYDNRPESPTYRLLNEFYLSELNRALLIFPKNVFHAVHNIGSKDAFLVNMPTQPYNHADPDKYRLPLNNDIIPYRFALDIKGW